MLLHNVMQHVCCDIIVSKFEWRAYCCFSLRSRPRSAPQTRNHVVMTCDPTSLASDTDCGSRDRLRHFRLQSPAEVDGVGSARYSCQLYRSFVDDCDVCRPRRAAADGSPTPPDSAAPDFRSNGGPKMSVDGGCDVIKTVTSSATGSAVTAPGLNGAIEGCPECLAESGRTLQSPVDRCSTGGPLATTSRLPDGPLATTSRHPCSTITV